MDKSLKILAVAIPLLVVIYLAYANLLVSHDFNYFYDIGSQQDNYLSPKSRVSDKITEDVDFRNLTSQLVYFNVPIPRGSDTVIVSAKFKDILPKNNKISIGASDNSSVWHYKYNWIFNETDSPETDGQWLVRETQFNLKEDHLYINNGKLSFLFNVPHLNQNKTQTNTYYIPIDWINVTVHKEGLLW